MHELFLPSFDSNVLTPAMSVDNFVPDRSCRCQVKVCKTAPPEAATSHNFQIQIKKTPTYWRLYNIYIYYSLTIVSISED